MTEKRQPSSSFDMIRWPETMWPANPTFLATLPQELLPNMDSLSSLVYPWDLLTLLRTTLVERITETRISEKVKFQNRDQTHIEGPVWIENGTRIAAHSVIIGPTYIGPQVFIGNHTLLRESLISMGSRLGYCSDIARSVLSAKCRTHRCSVIDSLVGESTSLGASRTGNQRLDKGEVRSIISGKRINTGLIKLGVIVGSCAFFGINSVTMPGVKIGNNCKIGPGVIVYEDLPNNSRILSKQETFFRLIGWPESKEV